MVKKNSSWLQEPQKTQWNQLIVQLICSTFSTNEMAEFHRRPRRKVWRYHWFPHCMGGMQMRLSRYIKLKETSQRKSRTLICSARKGGVHKYRKTQKIPAFSCYRSQILADEVAEPSHWCVPLLSGRQFSAAAAPLACPSTDEQMMSMRTRNMIPCSPLSAALSRMRSQG